MNTYALDNIKILNSLNDSEIFSFNDYKIIKGIKTNNKNNFEYGLYFTFHEILTLIDNSTRDRDEILTNINNAIDNLYDNEYFLNIIDDSDRIKNVIEEISTKVDIFTEKYLNKSFCKYITDEVYSQCISYVKSIVYYKRPVLDISNESDDDSGSDESDDFVKEDGLNIKED